MRLLFLLVLFLSACASHPSRDEKRKGFPPLMSALELSYQRGHNSYRLQVERKDRLVFGRSYADQSLLLEKKLTNEELVALQAMVENIFQQGNSEPLQLSRCRTPFELEMTVGEDKKKLRGCRSSGVGPLVNQFLHKADIMLLQEE